jgi:ABC-type transport system involved in multi-copper enzyme maturation permease subunit
MVYLPTPRWSAIGVVAAVVVAAAAVALTGPGEEDLARVFGLAMPTWVASIVIGVWLVGLEHGQKTMRRTISRNPNRLRLVMTKAALGVLAATFLTVLATAVAVPLLAIASAGHELKITTTEVLRSGLGSLANNVVVVVMALSLALLTRSMAGGMAVALGFFFVIDTILVEIPVVGGYMFSAVLSEVFSELSRDRFTEGIEGVGIVLAVALTLVWAAAFLAAGMARFVGSDVE